MNADFSRVRVHEGHAATHAGVVAYTKGESIHFAPGHYDPTSATCQGILGHELAHVQQHQRAGARIPDVPRGMVQASPIPTTSGDEAAA